MISSHNICSNKPLRILDCINERIFDNIECHYEPITIPKKLKSPSILFNGRTYVIGGGLDPFDQCFIINTIDLEITCISNLFTGRIKHGLVIMCEEIYAIGGIADDYLKSVEKFNGNIWEEITPLNYYQVQPIACEVNNAIYVISGGNVDDKYIEKYKDNQWTILPFQYPDNLIKIGAASFGNNLIIAGGKKFAFKANDFSKKAWRINCENHEIEELPEMPEADCFDFPGWEENGKAVMMGQKNYFEYDIIEKNWTYKIIPSVCSLCLIEDCGEECNYQKKIQFYKAFRLIKLENKLL